jgi:hypothetical protein
MAMYVLKHCEKFQPSRTVLAIPDYKKNNLIPKNFIFNPPGIDTGHLDK